MIIGGNQASTIDREPCALRQAQILFKGKRAGILAETQGSGSRFTYDQDWQTSIACALPREQGEHLWPVGLHPAFEHLTAEGWLRGLQARAGHLQDQDDFGLLLTYGADCIGAISVVPLTEDGEHIRPDLEDGPAVVTGRRTISGVQKKLLAYYDGERFRPSETLEQPATHIAKFNSSDVPTLVQNEDLSLRFAREILGEQEVTKAKIAAVTGLEGVALLVERFDRVADEKRRLEDFAQILGKPRGRDFKGKYESSYEEAASAVQRFSTRSLIDLGRFFRRVIFSILIGDADAHLKNFSLLERPEGLRLSPAYDQLNTSIYDIYDRDAALQIDGKLRPLENIDRSVLEGLGHTIGLPAKAIANVIDGLASAYLKSNCLKLAPNISPQDFRARYAQIVDNNARRIFG